MQNSVTLDRGAFLLSIDTELAWGTGGRQEYRQDYDRTRRVIDDLLRLCERHGIRATWAVVGHLFLENCKQVNGVKHPEIVRMAGKGRDWFDMDPCSDISSDPHWYGSDIVEKIMACPVRQEIGCHSFSHIVAEDDCTAECFESELAVCRALAQERGIELRSFVFPKNMVKHLGILERRSFAIFRGPDRTWFRRFPRFLRRIAHGIDNYLVPTAPTVMPEKIGSLWHVPGSYFYVHRRGWARFLPVGFRVRKAISGLRKAAKKKEIFHLWFHPFNVASDPDNLLAGLEKIFRAFSIMRERDMLINITMGELADHLYQKQ